MKTCVHIYAEQTSSPEIKVEQLEMDLDQKADATEDDS